MGILSWILFGLLAGWIAKMIMPGHDPGGFILTIALGIVGAVLGGFIATAMGYGSVTGFTIGSFLIAITGALVLLIGYRLVMRRRGYA